MTNPMDSLYMRLNKRGVSKVFVRRLLPTWWDDALANTPSALLQAQLIISSGMNFDLSSVRDSSADIQFKAAHRKFKYNKAVDSESIQLSAEYATGMAKLAVQAVKARYTAPLPDALSIRNGLLETHECVDLPALLDLCNKLGIPVLHITNLPGKKMDAVAIRQNGRSVIVLCKSASASYLLFHLAHEIGHIALGHLGTTDAALIDAKINSDGEDPDEKAADKFAVQLLNGRDARYSSKNKLMNASSLALNAVEYGKKNKIDAGHIILNYSYVIKKFALANTALKFLPSSQTDSSVVNKNLLDQLDIEALSDDQSSLLIKALSAQA
jgi:Zn-dependent peptidase ImmA (M78 family)